MRKHHGTLQNGVNMLNKKPLGQTGIEISPLGLGTVKFGRNQGVKYPEGFDIPSEETLSELLTLAHDLGINMLDTAPAYGISEERLGRLLSGQRNKWIIVCKAGEEFEDGQSSYNFTPDHFKYSLDRSLKRLNTDHIDIFLVHSDGQDIEILQNDDLIKTMNSFKEQGLVRAIGASTKTHDGGIKALELMDIVMAMYTRDYQDEKAVLDYAAQCNKGVILKKTLSSGHSDNIDGAFRFSLSHQAVDSLIVGTINPVHLKKNVEIIKGIINKG